MSGEAHKKTAPGSSRGRLGVSFSVACRQPLSTTLDSPVAEGRQQQHIMPQGMTSCREICVEWFMGLVESFRLPNACRGSLVPP